MKLRQILNEVITETLSPQQFFKRFAFSGNETVQSYNEIKNKLSKRTRDNLDILSQYGIKWQTVIVDPLTRSGLWDRWESNSYYIYGTDQLNNPIGWVVKYSRSISSGKTILVTPKTSIQGSTILKNPESLADYGYKINTSNVQSEIDPQVQKISQDLNGFNTKLGKLVIVNNPGSDFDPYFRNPTEKDSDVKGLYHVVGRIDLNKNQSDIKHFMSVSKSNEFPDFLQVFLTFSLKTKAPTVKIDITPNEIGAGLYFSDYKTNVKNYKKGIEKAIDDIISKTYRYNDYEANYKPIFQNIK